MPKNLSLPLWQSYVKIVIFFLHMQILKILKILMRICQFQYDPNVAICQQSYIMARRGNLNIRTQWEFPKVASGKILLFYKPKI